MSEWHLPPAAPGVTSGTTILPLQFSENGSMSSMYCRELMILINQSPTHFTFWKNELKFNKFWKHNNFLLGVKQKICCLDIGTESLKKLQNHIWPINKATFPYRNIEWVQRQPLVLHSQWQTYKACCYNLWFFLLKVSLSFSFYLLSSVK